MGPKEYRDCLKRLALSQRGASKFFGRDERTGRKWAEDKGSGPPPEVAMWLRYMIATKSTAEDIKGWIALYEPEYLRGPDSTPAGLIIPRVK